jgi:hypothetical protein
LISALKKLDPKGGTLVLDSADFNEVHYLFKSKSSRMGFYSGDYALIKTNDRIEIFKLNSKGGKSRLMHADSLRSIKQAYKEAPKLRCYPQERVSILPDSDPTPSVVQRTK